MPSEGDGSLRYGLDVLRPQFSRQLDILETLVSGRILVDVGAGGGVFLAAAKERGWEVSGQDSNAHAADAARAAFGLEFVDSLDAIAEGSVDVIRLSHVLEHVDHPVGFLEALKRKLKPGGILVVIVPNGGPLTYTCVNLLRRLGSRLPKLAVPMSPGFHLLGWSISSLKALTGKAGFTTVETRSISMGDKTYYPMFYDGLLRHVPLSEIPLGTLIRYWLPLFADNLGNPFGRGNWLVGYFRNSEG